MTRKYAKRGCYTSELTDCEQKIYDEIVNNGASKADIAKKFKVKESTIRKHIQNIFLKKCVFSQKELIIQHYKNLIEKMLKE